MWQVLGLSTAVSPTTKNKQSCGSAILPVSADAFGIFPKSRTAGIQTLVQCLVTRSHWYFWVGGKKKAIKTPTTLNTRPGHVSQGSLANTQKCIQCILFSGISLAVNKCSCLLVLKWYVIMNFPRDGNVIATFLIKG